MSASATSGLSVEALLAAALRREAWLQRKMERRLALAEATRRELEKARGDIRRLQEEERGRLVSEGADALPLTQPGALVYFVRRLDGCIKVGWTTNLTRRLYALRTVHGWVDLLGTMPGGVVLERELHERFAADRRDGEWFAPSELLMRYIAENAQ